MLSSNILTITDGEKKKKKELTITGWEKGYTLDSLSYGKLKETERESFTVTFLLMTHTESHEK